MAQLDDPFTNVTNIINKTQRRAVTFGLVALVAGLAVVAGVLGTIIYVASMFAS